MDFPCKYNSNVECESAECDKCGWNPVVAEKRLKAFKEARMSNIKLYKVPFTGYCEVWAESLEEAADNAEDIKQQFFAHYDYGEPVCLSKEDKNELD